MNNSQILYYLKSNLNNHLDIGSNVGALLESSHQIKKTKELFGVEINKDAVEIAKKRYASLSHYHFKHGSADELKYADESFNVATASEVLEHVPQELRKKTIKEIARTLEKDGHFILTVPHKGFFHFLDPSNFRFFFPKIYSFVSRLLGGRDRDQGFEGQKHGVVYHYHFSMPELRELLGPEFSLETVRFRGCVLAPIVEWLAFPLYRLNLTSSLLFRCLKGIQKLEYRINLGELLGYNVLIVAKKN